MADIKSETKTAKPETEPKAATATVATAPKAQTAAVEAPAAEKAPEPAPAPVPATEEAATPAPIKAATPAPAAKQAAKPARVVKAAKPARAAKKAAKPVPAPAAAKAAPAPAVKAAPVRRARKPLPVTKKPAAKPVKSVTAAAPRPVIQAARPAVTTFTTTLNKGPRIMKNETTKIADRVQAVFGDVNARAKDAFERNTRVAEEITDLTKGNVEALVASGKLAAKGVESLGQEVAEYSRKSFEDASSAFKSFAEVKSPTDFFRLQSEFARAQFDSFVAESSKLSETVLKLAGEVAEPITSRYSVAAEKVKAVTAF